MEQRPRSVNQELASDASHVGHVAPVPSGKKDPHATRWGDFLKACIKINASDLIMKSELAPRRRVKGALKALDLAPHKQRVVNVAMAGSMLLVVALALLAQIRG